MSTQGLRRRAAHLRTTIARRDAALVATVRTSALMAPAEIDDHLSIVDYHAKIYLLGKALLLSDVTLGHCDKVANVSLSSVPESAPAHCAFGATVATCSQMSLSGLLLSRFYFRAGCNMVVVRDAGCGRLTPSGQRSSAPGCVVRTGYSIY
ncbi:MAG: hypothetical protein IPK16_01665 [Anaerolineales bacterium]|nr:hypothetical protein [Anaerolineales bacterium]